MSTNDEIALQIAADKAKAEREHSRPVIVKGNQVDAAKIAWTIGAVAIDLATAVLVWQITLWAPYGIMWFIAGAAGLIWSEWLRERVGNNAAQRQIGERGVIVSGLSVLVMALFAGVVWVLKVSNTPWIEAVTVVSIVGLFLYHVYNAYRYHQIDDGVIAANAEAKLDAMAKKEINEIHRAARIVEAKKKALNTLAEYEKEHGSAILAALDGTGITTQYASVVNSPSLPAPAPSEFTTLEQRIKELESRDIKSLYEAMQQGIKDAQDNANPT